jgi:hypothetical protein
MMIAIKQSRSGAVLFLGGLIRKRQTPPVIGGDGDNVECIPHRRQNFAKKVRLHHYYSKETSAVMVALGIISYA